MNTSYWFNLAKLSHDPRTPQKLVHYSSFSIKLCWLVALALEQSYWQLLRFPSNRWWSRLSFHLAQKARGLEHTLEFSLWRKGFPYTREKIPPTNKFNRRYEHWSI